MSWWHTLKEFDNKGLLFDRIEKKDLAYLKNGYIVDRRIFKWPWMIFLLFVLGVTYANNWTLQELVIQTRVECPADARGPCENPFYQTCLSESEFCNQVNTLPTISPGVFYGTKPSPALSFAWPLFAIVLGLGLFWNHHHYNGGLR